MEKQPCLDARDPHLTTVPKSGSALLSCSTDPHCVETKTRLPKLDIIIIIILHFIDVVMKFETWLIGVGVSADFEL